MSSLMTSIQYGKRDFNLQNETKNKQQKDSLKRKD